MPGMFDDLIPAQQAEPSSEGMFEDLIPRQQPTAAQNIIGAGQGNPDEAAKALGIASRLNLPPELVKTDTLKYKTDADRADALGVIQNNPDFGKWLAKRQINAEVSIDDIRGLERAYNAARYFHSTANTSAMWTSIKNGINEAMDQPWLMTPEEMQYFQDWGLFKGPRNDGIFGMARAANEVGIMTLYDTAKIAGRMTQVGFGAWNGFVQALADRGLNRDFAGILHGEYLPPGNPVGFGLPAGMSRLAAENTYARTLHHIDALQTAMPERFQRAPVKSFTATPTGEIGTIQQPVPRMNDAARLSLREGEVPRPGVDPVADAIHVEQQTQDAAAFDDLFKKVQDAKLRERSPEALADMLRGAVGGQNIYVPARTVMEAYAQQAPFEGDKIFGWMPNSMAQIDAALKTGTDLSIPMEEFLAHADPKVYELIKDKVKFRETGVSNEEAQALRSRKPEDYAQETPLAAAVSEGAESGGPGEPRPQETPAAPAQEQAAPAGQQPPKVVATTEKDQLREAVKTENIKDRLFNELKSVGSEGEKEILRLRDLITEALNDKEVRDAVGNMLDNPDGAKDALAFVLGEQGGGAGGTVPPIPPSTPLGDAFKREKKFLYLNPLFANGALRGAVDQTMLGQYSRKIAATDAAAYEKVLQTEMRAASKRLSPEWERDYGEITSQVESDLRSQPSIVADRYLRTGELPTGEVVKDAQKLDATAVERLLGEPLERYTVKRGGASPEEIAPLLGFENGAQLVQALKELNDGMKATDKGPVAYFKQMVKTEADRRMEIAHGTLSENILDEARDLAMGEPYIDILSDEMTMLRRNLAEVPGDIPLTKDMIKGNATRLFAGMNAQDVSFYKFAKASQDSALEAEKALLKGDYRGAFEAKQRQIVNVYQAKMAKRFEKRMITAERNFQRIMRNETRGSVDQDYWDNARNILSSVGFDDRPVQAPLRSLDQLIDDSSGQVSVAPWLTSGEARRWNMRYPNMTVEEHNALNDSIRSILNAGAEAKKVFSVHAHADLDNKVFDIDKENERFGIKPLGRERTLTQRAGSFSRYINSWNVLVERLFDYADGFRPEGPLTQFIDRPLREAYNKELRLQELTVNKLKKLEQYNDSTINDYVDNPYMRDPISKNLYKLTRKELRVMMLHMGTESGFDKLTRGHDITPEMAWNLVRKNATENDINWVNGMHEIFESLGDEAAPMIRRYTGVEFERLPAKPFTLTLKDGKDHTLTGGYAPIFYDKARGTIDNGLQLRGELYEPDYVAALPAHSYAMPRTSVAGWIDLNGTMMRSRITQMIHDIAFREAVRNAQKFFASPDFRMSMVRYWGKEYADLLNPWLKDIANAHNFDDTIAQGGARFIAAARQAVTSTLVNYNIGTMLKHGATAGIMSAAQINSINPLSALRDLAASTANVGIKGLYNTAADMLKRSNVAVYDESMAQAVHDILSDENARNFIWQNSPFMRNRARPYVDTIPGAFERAYGGASDSAVVNWLGKVRDKNEQFGRFMVAMSDMTSAMPLWLDTYKKSMLRNGVKSDAIFEADRAVQRAHGSNFIGDKPYSMRVGGANTFAGQVVRTFTALYGFWNHLFNNIVQLGWDMGAIARRGVGSEPGANVQSIINRVLMYGVGTVAVEEMMAPALTREDKESWFSQMWKATVRTFGSMFPGLREATNMLGGYEPSTGMLGIGLNLIRAATKDAFQKTSRNAIAHFGAIAGTLGFGSAQVGRTVQGGVKQLTGAEKPQNLEELRALYRKGYIRSRR